MNVQVYYENEEVNLKVAVCWSCAGWTSPGCSNSATVSITGRQPEDEGLRRYINYHNLHPQPVPERAEAVVGAGGGGRGHGELGGHPAPAPDRRRLEEDDPNHRWGQVHHRQGTLKEACDHMLENIL